MSDQQPNNNKPEQFVAPLTQIYRDKLKKKAKTPITQSEVVTSNANNKGSFNDFAQLPKQSLGANIDYSNTQGIKQGFIKKWVNMMRGFKKRYFVLTNELLIYYKTKKGNISEKGQISLKLAKIDPKTMNDKRMIIGTGTGEIHLEFNTIQEKREWLMAIDECKRKLHLKNYNLDENQIQSLTGNQQQTEIIPQEEGKQYLSSQGPEQHIVQRKASSQNMLAFEDQMTPNSYQPKKKESKTNTDDYALDAEVKNALNMALESNILKHDSTLSVNLADTWAAHSSFEDALNMFKKELQKNQDKIPIEIIKLGEILEQSSNELKKSVTNSIKSVEQTKLQIIKILGKADKKMKERASVVDDKGYLGEESKAYVSFSQDFNEQVEHKRSSKQRNSSQLNKDNAHQNHEQVFETARKSRFEENKGNELEFDDEDDQEQQEEDDFFDAQGDEETLQHVQSEILKPDEKQMEQETQRDSVYMEEYRTILPALKPPDQKVSVWKVIKDAVGKDLSRFCVPVYFNEPISMVQKVSEIMEYENLLVKANQEPNQLKRILYVAAFSIAQYKCSDKRLCKPFNPILGETFELKRPNYQYFGEQVSHHPPISACFAQSDSYEFWMNTNMKTNFWGKSLEIKPFGYQNVRLIKTKEHFIVERPNSSVNNLIFGEMYIEHFGQSMVKNLQTGDICNIEYKKKGWSGKNAYEIEGYALLRGKEKQFKIYGKWNEYLNIQNLQTGEDEQIWAANPMPPLFDSMYNFTHFTLQLNYLPPALKEKLPPTDSRLRPDQRYLENGDLVKAASEKARLEDKQRKMRKEKEIAGIEHRPKYFEEYTDSESGEKGYRYVRDYWEDRRKGDWSHLEDLF